MDKMNWKTGGKKFRVELTIDTSGSRPKVVPELKEEDFQANEESKKRYVEFKKYYDDLQVKGYLKKHWAEFQRWGWKISNDILRFSKVMIDPINGIDRVDYQLLRENKLKHLLLDWSLKDDDNSLAIERTVDIGDSPSVLTDTCWASIQEVDPNIVNAFLNKADLVLELGQEEGENFTKGLPQPSAPKETE